MGGHWVVTDILPVAVLPQIRSPDDVINSEEIVAFLLYHLEFQYLKRYIIPR